MRDESSTPPLITRCCALFKTLYGNFLVFLAVLAEETRCVCVAEEKCNFKIFPHLEDTDTRPQICRLWFKYLAVKLTVGKTVSTLLKNIVIFELISIKNQSSA